MAPRRKVTRKPIAKGAAIRSDGPPSNKEESSSSESEQEIIKDIDIPETPEATLAMTSDEESKPIVEVGSPSKKRKSCCSQESPESKKKKEELSAKDYLNEEIEKKKKKKKKLNQVAIPRSRRKDSEIISENRKNAQSMIATSHGHAVLNEMDVVANTFCSQITKMKECGVDPELINQFAKAHVDTFTEMQSRKQKQAEIATDFFKHVTESKETIGSGKQRMEKYGANFKMAAAAVLQNASLGVGSNFVGSGTGKNSIAAVQGIAQKAYGTLEAPIELDDEPKIQVERSPLRFEEFE